MELSTLKLLEDIRRAGSLVMQFTTARSFEDYSADAMLRSAVERQLGIIGEALACLAKRDPATLALIPENRKIIAFRNVLIHGYDLVDQEIVWDAVCRKLPELLAKTRELLDQNAGTAGSSQCSKGTDGI